MSRELLTVFFNIQAACIFVSFITSLSLISNKQIPKYMRGFFWYPMIGILAIAPAFIARNFSESWFVFGFIANKFSILFHYSFLSIFIIRAIPGKKNDIYLSIIFWLFLLLILFFLLGVNIETRSDHSFAIANLGLVVYCIAYYYYLFNNSPTFNLISEPAFWIITGIFFSMSVHIPIFLTIDILHFKISINTYRLLISVSIFCYSLMHIFFIKAYLCAIHPRIT